MLAVPGDRWESPSPCKEWSACEVFAHVVDSEHRYLSRFDLVGELPEGIPSQRWPLVRLVALQEMGDAIRSRNAFGPPVEVDETADLQTRFVAFLGKNP